MLLQAGLWLGKVKSETKPPAKSEKETSTVKSSGKTLRVS